MNNFNNGEKGETALGVLEDQEKKTSDVANEEAPVFKVQPGYIGNILVRRHG